MTPNINDIDSLMISERIEDDGFNSNRSSTKID
jgi:hypothetical protein